MAAQTYVDGRITIDPAVCNGKPTLRGKRVTVQTIPGYLNEGGSEADDIRACLRFATQITGQRYDLALDTCHH